MSRSPSPQEHLVKIESLLMQTEKENMNEVSSKNVQALKAVGQQGIQCRNKGSKDNKDSQGSHSIRSPKERRKRMRMKRRKKKEKVTKVIQVFCGCSTRFEDHQDALVHTRNYTHTHTHTHTHITCKCQMPHTWCMWSLRFILTSTCVDHELRCLCVCLFLFLRVCVVSVYGSVCLCVSVCVTCRPVIN